MKAILISDVHLHRWTYGATTSEFGYNSRLGGQLKYLLSLLGLARLHNVRDIICLGDLFHTNQTIHAEVLQIASLFLHHLQADGIKFHCLVGNHDMGSKNGLIHTLGWIQPYGSVISHQTIFTIGGRQITALPYTEDVELLKNTLDSTSSELVLLHQGINLQDSRGSAWTLNEIFTADMVPDRVKRVFTGHYHKPVDKGNISIVGSTMQHNWSDADKEARGCILLDLNTLNFERIPNLVSPRFVECDFEQLPKDPSNLFLRVHNVPKGSVEDVRSDLLKLGAISVEIDLALDAKPKGEQIKSAITLDSAVAEFEQTTTEPCRAIGRQLREQLYEAPKVPS